MAAVKHDSNTDIFRGQLFVFINGNPIAYGKDATLNITTDEIDVSNKMMASGWKVSLPGNNSYSVTSESLYTQKEGQYSFEVLLDKQIKRETVEFVMGTAKVTDETTTGGVFELDKSKPYYEGVTMISSLDLKSTDGDIASCSSSFTGVGALKKGDITSETKSLTTT